ncbi:MAG: hypothetical protein GWP06_05775 [Actinobacteria bacterium]|nr:hypothetical protein [Actinomycetota bacterium]
MEKHVKTTGILWIAKGILGILVGFLVFAIMLGIGIFANTQGGEEALPILAIIGLFVAGLLTVLSIPEILAGIGILKFKQWGKILGLVVAALNLLDIPVGTALAIYSFWVLLKDESQELFS